MCQAAGLRLGTHNYRFRFAQFHLCNSTPVFADTAFYGFGLGANGELGHELGLLKVLFISNKFVNLAFSMFFSR